MAQETWGDLYKGGDRESVPGGTYDFRCKAVRPFPQSSMLFLDLEVIAGPETGKIGQINLYVPDPGAKGSFFFQKKIAGMLTGPPPGFVEAIAAGDKERALNLLANGIEGRSFTGTVTVRTDGEYAGSNELESTKPLEGQAPQVLANPAAAVQDPAPAPAGTAPAAPVDEVAALRAKLAALENGNGNGVPETVPDAAGEASAAMADGDVPF